MNPIHSLTFDHQHGIAIATERDVQAFRDLAYDFCHAEAERRNTYYSWAMGNVDLHGAYEPDAEEVRQYLGDEELGDWRKVMTVTATLATVRFLETQVEGDMTLIEQALGEARENGFEPVKLHALCQHGWAPHESEETWLDGTMVLHTWHNLDGGTDALMLRVNLSEESQVWIELNRVG